MTALSDLKMFATHPHPCSYLDDKRATTLFIDPEATIDAHTYSQLADLGFRRSGSHIYRPHCDSCRACTPARVSTAEFKPSRNQRKIINRNKDITVEQVSDISGDEFYQLYERYISLRHSDGDMYPPDRDQYQSFLSNNIGNSRFYGFFLARQLVALAVTDVMDNGLSAIYTYFDPQMERRSLGRYAILWQIEQCQQLGVDYLYLGYWIKECRKMSYKTDYRPLQLLINNRWLSLS
ncbi:MAG: arginine-tRNA-protein transferase [Oceanicoccus sp.]|jgi:arginine-tRNA-protein transferase